MRTRLPIRAICLFLSTMAFSAGSARAQDPEKIIDQYIRAQGGGKNLAKSQTISIEGTLTNVADGKTGTYTFDTKLPNRYYSELVIGDQNVIEAYNGKIRVASHNEWRHHDPRRSRRHATRSRQPVLQFASRQRQEK